MRLVEKRRGDSDPAPDRLALERVLWLDFDGRGYTAHDRITGLEEVEGLPAIKMFHAGTQEAAGALVTNGGRVLGVTALGPDLRAARATAYAAVERIRFDGAQYRRDIGAQALR